MAEIAPLELAIITNLGLMLASFIVLGHSVNTIQQQSFPSTLSGCIAAPELVKGHIFYQLLSVGVFLVAFTIPFVLKYYLVIRRSSQSDAAMELTPKWLAYSITLSVFFTVGGFGFSAISVGYMIDSSIGYSICHGYPKDSYIVMGIISLSCLILFVVAAVHGVVKAKEATQ